MHQRNRRLAAAAAVTSAIAVVGALGSGVAGPRAARAATDAVTFTSSPTVAGIVAHYTVTAASRSGTPPASSTGVDSQDQLPDLVPKSFAPRNAARPSTAAPAAAANTVAPLAGSNGNTPRPAASFIGQQGSNKTCSYFAQGCNPPDMAVAASPSFVLQGVNTQWEVLSTSGQVQPGWPVSAAKFFNVPNVANADGTPCDAAHGNQPFLSDPRAIYDPVQHRFWAAMLQVEGGLGIAGTCPFKSVYFIAVTQTSDPRGAWNVYEFEMSGGAPFAADFTQIGLNRDAVFFSANMFGLKAGFYAEVFEANKAQMEAGKADFTASGFRNLQGTGPGTVIANVGPFLADTVQPVMALGDNAAKAGGSDGLFVDTIDGPDLINGNLCSSAADACKGVALWRMANPTAHDHGGPAPTLTGTYVPNTKPFYFPPAADQPSCNQCVDGNDLRIPAIPVLRDGTIYTAWGTGIDNGTQVVPGIEWAQLAVGESEDGRVPTTTGYFNLSGDDAATYPAIMPDANGNVLMVYEHMGHSTFPEVRYTTRRGNQAQFTDPGRLLKAGEASYRPTLCGTAALPVCRWGDYEATSFDGNGRIWFAGEYANSNTAIVSPAFGRNWGTWIGAVNTED